VGLEIENYKFLLFFSGMIYFQILSGYVGALTHTRTHTHTRTGQRDGHGRLPVHNFLLCSVHNLQTEESSDIRIFHFVPKLEIPGQAVV
jgi:hypothetical protein